MNRCTVSSRIARFTLVAALFAFAVPITTPAAPPSGKGGPKNTMLSAEIEPGADTGTLTISGGRAPYTVDMLTDAGPTELYSGTATELEVPLLAGETEFQITDSKRGDVTTSGFSTIQFWVASPSTRMVNLYDAVTETITVPAVYVSGDETPTAVKMTNIAVRENDKHLFVVFSDESGGTSRNRLIELATDGSVVSTISVPGSYKIQDVAFDAAGDIYVCDRGLGSYTERTVRIVKISGGLVVDGPEKGAVLSSTSVPMPAGSVIGYPMANLYTMIDYTAATNRIVARINTSTLAIMDPADLSVDEYRFSGDYAHTCMLLNTTSGVAGPALYTGGSGFGLTSFFGKQSGFMTASKYLDSNIYFNPSHDWKIAPTLPAMLDVSIDTNDYVYTIQHDGANAITRAYVYDPVVVDGLGVPVQVKTVDLPGGTKIAVVR